MELYKNYKKLKYFLKNTNNIFDIKFACIEFSYYSDMPLYFCFDCKYKYFHFLKISYYENKAFEYLELKFKINLYCNDNINYYIKFKDLFEYFDKNLEYFMWVNDYKRLKKYDLYNDINDLAEYIKINFGLEVRKD